MQSNVTQTSSFKYSSKQIEHCGTNFPDSFLAILVLVNDVRVGEAGVEKESTVVDLGEVSLISVPLMLEMVLSVGDIATNSGSRSLNKVVLRAANEESDTPRGTTPNCSESARRAS